MRLSLVRVPGQPGNMKSEQVKFGNVKPGNVKSGDSVRRAAPQPKRFLSMGTCETICSTMPPSAFSLIQSIRLLTKPPA